MPKLFLLGTTGYIGGDALYALYEAHPDWEYTCVVRGTDKGSLIAAQYPKIRLVYGDLDSIDLLTKEAANADVVVNWASADHSAAAAALIDGLSKRTANEPGYYIHTSGTGVLCFDDLARKTFGESSTKVYDDWDSIGEVTSLPIEAPHRPTDKVVLDGQAAHAEKVKTAIVCPPTIYDQGRGPVNQRSIQLPELSRVTIEQGNGVQVGAGKTIWTQVNVHDLSDLYLLLIEAAVQGGGNATWGPEGYYFSENGEFLWADVAKEVAHEAHRQGLIKEDKIVSYAPEDVSKLHPYGPVVWGANSRGKAIRARKLLGWNPKDRSLLQTVSGAVDIEAKKKGLKPGHAAKAAGTA
ncbi:nucleoside-diphosphate-sugar epimerase [Viridothelium virens]|uniref:Nucleoside-diphosphate-sugar epimerase n=1 Tax=Viridothelium virens TaxID=1048519 RepID=A0A6A6GTG5_VIRVR|nr:nucleoside-diphosphate-sugar epimerase [Viridothelium virens]